MTECQEVAGNMPVTKRLTFDEAMAYVRSQMPDETFTIRSNVAETLVYRSRVMFPTGARKQAGIVRFRG